MTNPENQVLSQAGGEAFQYDRWRVTFLATVLRVVAALGLLLILSNFPTMGNTERVAFSVIYLAFLAATFLPMSYAVRAGTLILSGYLVGLYTILQAGPWSGAVSYFLAVTVFAVLLFNRRVDRWVFSINLATILLAGILNILGYLPLMSAEAPAAGLMDWLSYAADYLVLAIASIWAISLLKAEFKSVAEKFQAALGVLSRDRADLEKRVEERAAGLIKKTDQLRAASYITRQIAELQELDTILNVVTRLVSDQFGFRHAGIFLMNETGDEVVLVSASSEGGRRMVESGHAIKVNAQGLVAFAASQKKSRIALDVGPDAVSFNNPNLPDTRSEVALPMLVRDRVLGVLDIQSDQPMAFSTEDIDVLQTLADQVAVTIENMRLLEESQTALMQIEALTASRTREAWGQKVREGAYAYTYTPLGVRAGGTSEETDNALKVPITLRGQRIGTLSLARKDGAQWSELDRNMVQEVAYQAGLAIENVRLVEDATQRAGQEQLVGELAARFSQSMDIDSLLQTAARELGQIPNVAEVSVFLGEMPSRTSERRRAK